MNFYRLENANEDCELDVMDGIIVRASSEREAREIAAKHCLDEGPEVWLNEASCQLIDENGPPGVMLSSSSGF